MFASIYKKIVIDFSKLTLFLILLIVAFSLYQSKNFNLDASSDALLLEGDPDLKYLREVNQTYGSKDFLVLTYTPVSSFTEKETILNLQLLKSKIEKLSWVDSVITVIDVPLLKSTDEGLMERLKNYKTLAYPEIDRKRGFEEIINSPIYKNYVISEDGKTSGVVIYLKKDERLAEYIKVKDQYYIRSNETGLSKEEKVNYKNFIKEYEDYKNLYNIRNHQNISEIRDVISKYGQNAKIHLGGIPMIADDMMSYIKSDIVVFGIGVFIFIILTLWFIFKNLKWVVMPLLGCSTSVIIMIGLLSFFGWKVTVISSNFIALMLILNMAMNIHLTVRFLQLKKEFSQITKSEAIFEASKKMMLPILYTVLTTICAFLSLVFSGIKPIIDFGWMMTLGLIVSLLVTFLLLPSLINLLSSNNEIGLKDTEKSFITTALGNFTKNNKIIIFGSTLLIIIFSIVGIFKLEVENSFINYFDKETEIYKGMKKIDDDLGGTTPLNIILKFPPKTEVVKEGDDEFDEWEEDNENEEDKSKYWFTRDKMDKIIKVHDYLDSLPEIGKVLSFGSILRVAEDLNKKELQSLEIAVLYSKIPKTIKNEIISPYISVEKDEARISVRIKDSLKDLRRNDLINKINSELNTKLGLEKDEYKLAGVLILFNNLLQSLFKSQILTLGIVILGIFIMFFILFRNLIISFIGVVPNFIAAFFILGIIGSLGIPLDMMTITIAAITVGIAVDNSIHYIYRFKEEFQKINNYNKTLDRCHSTVGVAILNTSITIVFGFSILVLSNFIPTIYFGVFTGIAMLLAMISVLTLLPKLILTFKPFGKEFSEIR
ncbi:MMPL family transporter [Pelagibacterales bacterium SAG-MED28]|nr:MMPL family transporter [Pelagibacterales bacterium SAG-MED28]|tara:strand:+ start:39 stop:2519 length:2481 start_codon:yes stop_codon:yes gene_type:complete